MWCSHIKVKIIACDRHCFQGEKITANDKKAVVVPFNLPTFKACHTILTYIHMYILISVTLWSKIGVYISTLRLGRNLGKIVNLIYEPKSKNFEQKNFPKNSRPKYFKMS